MIGHCAHCSSDDMPATVFLFNACAIDLMHDAACAHFSDLLFFPGQLVHLGENSPTTRHSPKSSSLTEWWSKEFPLRCKWSTL
jgi:hypothetical protein